MSGNRRRHYSDNIWSNSFKYAATSVPFNKKKEDDSLSEFLSSIDESPEFYDPYSELNLFLSQKIKPHCDSSKKWSLKIQEELIEKITPDFKEKFPRYRLGVSALKKTWEKIAYFSHQIENQKDAIAKDGKLNIPYFIRENLKNYTAQKHSGELHPSHFAQQVATKMSECIAAIDGVRPQTDLAKMIWSIQRNLLTDRAVPSPYDEYDKIDKLIVKTILEISAKEPQIGHHELEQKVKDSLRALNDLPCFSTNALMRASVAALLAEKRYTTSTFHALYFAEQKNAVEHFIARHAALCKTASPLNELSEFVRRICALYALASNLPKDLSENQVKEAIGATYPHTLSERPDLPQCVYAFISAELVLMRNEEYCRSPVYVMDAIWTAYKEASHLPVLKNDFLEIAIWKHLSQTEGLLEKLPYRIGQRIEEEIANILIDNPTQNFSSLVYETVQFFKRAKELVQLKTSEEIEKKVHNWAVQGDMLCRWIRLDQESTLLRLITQKWNDHPSQLPHHSFVSEICQEYLKSYSELTPYAGQLTVRVWILYKYCWYTQFSAPAESSYDRFLKWHSSCLLFSGPTLDHAHLVHQLEEIVCKTSPLIPFDKKQADACLS